jgi:hypothetical protein
MFDFKMSNSLEKIAWMGLRLQARDNHLRQTEAYYDGKQPTAFVAPDVVAQLQGRISGLSVNYPQLVVSTLTERLKLTGFRVDGAQVADPELWSAWTRNQMGLAADWIHRDALALGRGYCTVWADASGQPLITPESPTQVYCYRDPENRQITGALKMWSFFDDLTSAGKSWAVLYLADRIESFENQSPVAPNSVPPANGWMQTGSVPNPLGRVNVVEFRNSIGGVLDFNGTSEYACITDLVDALNKTFQDALVASEYTAMPRRWATGLAVPNDDDGQPINPFSQEKSRVWSVEDVQAKFGQFDTANLAGFETLANMIIRQIRAVTSLPEYLVGLNTSNTPSSADAIRAANLGLTTKAANKTDLFSAPWSEVAQLAKAVQTGRPADSIEAVPLWAPIEDRSQAMVSDSVSKLVAAGVPLALALEREAGWSPDEIAALRRAQQQEAIRKAPLPSFGNGVIPDGAANSPAAAAA